MSNKITCLYSAYELKYNKRLGKIDFRLELIFYEFYQKLFSVNHFYFFFLFLKIFFHSNNYKTF